MTRTTRRIQPILLAFAGLAACAVPALGAGVADFYKGRQIVMAMGTSPGGSFQVYTQVFAAHMGKHIPGHPTIVANFMPGAGGTKAANYYYAVAAQDGSQILMTHALSTTQMLRPKGLKYDAQKFNWLGAFSAINQLLTVWHTHPVNKWQDLKKTQLVMGSFAKNHLTYQWLYMTNALLGTKMKLVTGYRGGAKNHLAMQQGETAGWAASWGNLNGTKPQWLANKTVKLLINYGLERIPEIPDVPTLSELVKPEDRAIVDFLSAGTPVSRSLAVGPKVPADRVAALRKAMEDTMKDPGFLADAKKRKIPLRPRTWQEVDALVKQVVTAPPELVARVKKATGL